MGILTLAIVTMTMVAMSHAQISCESDEECNKCIVIPRCEACAGTQPGLCCGTRTCPGGWTTRTNTTECYFFSKELRATFFDAFRTCRLLNAELVRVLDEFEDTFIKDNIAMTGNYWISAQDLSQEGCYQYAAAGSTATIPFTPSSFIGRTTNDEDCVAVSKSGWDDMACTNNNNRFICKTNQPPLTTFTTPPPPVTTQIPIVIPDLGTFGNFGGFGGLGSLLASFGKKRK